MFKFHLFPILAPNPPISSETLIKQLFLFLCICMYFYISHFPLYIFFPLLTIFCFLIFIYLFLAALGLCCYTWAFSSCSERGATLHCGVRASHYAGFSCYRARASVVAVRGLSSCGMQAPGPVGFSSCGTWAQQLWLAGSRAQAQ